MSRLKRTSLLCALLTMLVSVLLLAGCGGGDKTAKGAAELFVAAMQKGDVATAARLLDYETDARAQNSDWDSFPASQRKLIVGKLAEERASTLQQTVASFPAETKVTAVQENGETAQATLEGGKFTSLELTLQDKAWRISGMK